jgi:hypothetical protein
MLVLFKRAVFDVCLYPILSAIDSPASSYEIPLDKEYLNGIISYEISGKAVKSFPFHIMRNFGL